MIRVNDNRVKDHRRPSRTAVLMLEKIGKDLCIQREERGISITRVAKDTHHKVETIRKLEKGEIGNLRIIESICKYYGLNLLELIYESEEYAKKMLGDDRDLG